MLGQGGASLPLKLGENNKKPIFLSTAPHLGLIEETY